MFLNQSDLGRDVAQEWVKSLTPTRLPALSPVYRDGFQPFDLQAGSPLWGGASRAAGRYTPASPRDGISLLPLGTDGPGLPGVPFFSFPFAAGGGGGEGGGAQTAPSGDADMLCLHTFIASSPLGGGAFCGAGASQSAILNFTQLQTGVPIHYSTNLRFDLTSNPPRLVHDRVENLQVRLRRSTTGNVDDVFLDVFGLLNRGPGNTGVTVAELSPC